ncbi:hypothetical protein D9619_003885 [Psilocybe cf. subviscida]|uniref:Uncharacterized protein n=1 Tax=Psilocybe cf. subviscida TaxID=2480587 RepID=A0A8H5BNR4_9AGAR|nr:hypothetical protein D9619_003885 [Psilocybe cf. subviscida]
MDTALSPPAYRALLRPSPSCPPYRPRPGFYQAVELSSSYSFPSLPAFPTARGWLSRGFCQAVVAALTVSLANGQPAVGAFSLQDEEDDVDVSELVSVQLQAEALRHLDLKIAISNADKTPPNYSASSRRSWAWTRGPNGPSKE